MNPSAANVTDHAPGSRSMPLIGPKPVTFAAAALVVAVSAGCSSGHATAAPRATGVQTLAFGATDGFRFTPAAATVHTGRVRIILTDAGSYPHNIAFPALGETSQSVSGSPGQTSTSMLVTINTPGRYSFVCTYHSSAGMKGRLVVLNAP